MAYSSTPKKRKKIASGRAVDDKKAMSNLPPAPDPRVNKSPVKLGGGLGKNLGTNTKPSIGSYTSKNTTTNARAGMNYRPVVTRKGVIHVYENGERVLVKKKKSANPPRTFSRSSWS